MSAIMEAALEAARVAGETALRRWRATLDVETKADGSPVTAADREAERAARVWIEARFPEDGILGEEFGHVRPGAVRRWLVDPVDGTRTFARGVPLWGSMVAVAEGERVLAGAIACPAVSETLAAAPGAGCWWNGARCAVSAVADLARATVLMTDERCPGEPRRAAAWRGLAARAELARTWGDCYGYLLVATGRAEAMADPALAPWDAAALQPIIEEAGGVFTDWTGAATAFGGDAIATNRALAGAVREALGAKEAR